MPFQSPRLVVMIDGQGNVHADIARLRSAYAGAATIGTLDQFMLHTLGFIRVILSGGHVQMKLRPARVSKTTLAAALYCLSDYPPDRFTASIYSERSGAWQDTILPNAMAAAATLGNLVEEAAGKPSRLLRRRGLQPNEIVAHPELVSSIGSWRETDGMYGRPELDRLAHHEMGGSFLRLKWRKGEMILDAVGPCLPKFAERSLRGRIGENFAGHVDQAYANACIEAYRQVIDRWEPLAEEVEAKAFWPGYGYLSRRYTRLVIPLRGPRGSVEVFSATKECTAPSIYEAAS